MSRSNDAGHFFQTSDALATTERKAAKAKNKHGSPIKLPSKILAMHPAEQDNVYVAEAAGEVKKVNLQSGKIERVYTQGNAPLTCLATASLDQGKQFIFAGSWDKNIYAIDAKSKTLLKTFQSHTDFIKCLLATTIDNTPILISGSADATIIVWDISDSNFGKVLHKLKGHTKALQHLIINPLSQEDGSSPDSLVIFSASSDREIRRWHISIDSAHELQDSIEKPIVAHETSVYSLVFDSDGDLWTASADKTAKHLVRSRNWEADTTLEHPDFVRDVVLFEDLGLVVTACRDEEVRVWESSSGKLVCTYSGHFEEVTSLVRGSDGRSVVSGSIDGTVRKWSLERTQMAKYLEEREKEERGEVDNQEVKKGGSMLTAEEEAELAELMDDDE